MKPITVREITSAEHEELKALYHQTKDVRVRTRTQMILLAYEEEMTAPQIAKIVRKDEQTVRRWIKRFNSEGVNGLADSPRSGAKRKISDEYREKVVTVVRRRPRALGEPYSLWTLQRLVEYMAVETGVRVSAESVRLILKENDIVISRPQHKVSSPDPEYMVKKRRLKSSAMG